MTPTNLVGVCLSPSKKTTDLGRPGLLSLQRVQFSPKCVGLWKYQFLVHHHMWRLGLASNIGQMNWLSLKEKHVRSTAITVGS